MKYLWGHRWRVVVAALAVAMGVYLTITPPPGTPVKPTAAAMATGRALDRKLPALNWDDTSLNAALNEIERGATVSIRYDLDALRADGIDPVDLVVTARLRDVRASKAMEFVLANAHPQHRLRYFTADDGAIVVTTPRGDAKRAVTRVYNVSDLIFASTWSPQTPQQESQLNQEVVLLLTETVDPESWIDAGGEIGRMTLQNGIITVHQTPENLRLFEGLLGQMCEGHEADRLRRLLQEDPP